MKKVFVFLILLVLFACVREAPRIIVTNKTKVSYDSISVFSTGSPTTFYDVGANDVCKGQIVFDENNLSDGGYTIQIYKDGKTVQRKNFGYYTNGGSLNREIKVVIEPDTLEIKYK